MAMTISIVNFTTVDDSEVQRTIRAINRQIANDFEPYWHMGARLRLEGRAGHTPQRELAPELRGDAVIYLWSQADVEGALGYHEANNRGLPSGFVFTEISRQIGEPWSVTLSHEALELIGDANVNILAAGPHPANRNKDVFHWYEMCDAVQAETYELDDVTVSNFVLPLYFTPDEELGGRNDFLNRSYEGKTLRSFGINPGGYVGFYNPETGKTETFSMRGDQKAELRLKVKSRLSVSRRGVRYGLLPQRRPSMPRGEREYAQIGGYLSPAEPSAPAH